MAMGHAICLSSSDATMGPHLVIFILSSESSWAGSVATLCLQAVDKLMHVIRNVPVPPNGWNTERSSIRAVTKGEEMGWECIA